MLEIERNRSLEPELLAEFFARLGWYEDEAGVKLEWVLAGSHEWVTCKYEGELVGFGRSSRLGAGHTVVFDVLVDRRFEGHGLDGVIVRLLVEAAGRFERVSVYRDRGVTSQLSLLSLQPVSGSGHGSLDDRAADHDESVGVDEESVGPAAEARVMQDADARGPDDAVPWASPGTYLGPRRSPGDR